jgi:hypothetical protein
MPIRATCEWQTKVVTTDPPKLIPHDEFSLNVELRADEPFRVVSLSSRGNWLGWNMGRTQPSTVINHRINFMPYSWKTNDAVTVSHGFLRAGVNDAELKRDPRPLTLTPVPRLFESGQQITICEIPRHDVHLSIIVIAGEDTERRRGDRWRVRPRSWDGLPTEIQGLVGGRMNGHVTRQ